MSSIDTSSPDIRPGSFVNLDAYLGGIVSVSIGRTPQGKRTIDSMVNVTRDDFLASVSTELKVTIVDDAKLPAATVINSGSVRVGSTTWYTRAAYSNIESLRQEVFERLALIAHLSAHPPVDPRVETLAALLWNDTVPPHGSTHTFADARDATRQRFHDRAAQMLATGLLEVKAVK